jgi:hypothetical protein
MDNLSSEPTRFVLINYKTKQKLTCCWTKTHKYFNETIHYIGVTDGLGGYNYMLSLGFQDRRFRKPVKTLPSKRIVDYKLTKWKEIHKKRLVNKQLLIVQSNQYLPNFTHLNT